MAGRKSDRRRLRRGRAGTAVADGAAGVGWSRPQPRTRRDRTGAATGATSAGTSSVAEELHRRRQQHAADDRRVEQDRRREPDAELLEHQHRERCEDGEDTDHDDRGARDDARGRLDPVRDRLVGGQAALDRLTDPAQQEDVVVHREPEQDHEQEQRDNRVDPPVGVKPRSPLPMPCWKTSTSTP